MEFTQPQKNPYAVMDLYLNNNGGWDMFCIYKIYIVVQNAGNGLNRKHILQVLHSTDNANVWENDKQLP